MNLTGLKDTDIRTSRGNPKEGCTVTLLIAADGRKGFAEVNFPRLAQDGAVIEELRERAPANVRVSVSQYIYSFQKMTAQISSLPR